MTPRTRPARATLDQSETPIRTSRVASRTRGHPPSGGDERLRLRRARARSRALLFSSNAYASSGSALFCVLLRFRECFPRRRRRLQRHQSLRESPHGRRWSVQVRVHLVRRKVPGVVIHRLSNDTDGVSSSRQFRRVSRQPSISAYSLVFSSTRARRPSPALAVSSRRSCGFSHPVTTVGARARENTIPLAAASPFAAAPETRLRAALPRPTASLAPTDRASQDQIIQRQPRARVRARTASRRRVPAALAALVRRRRPVLAAARSNTTRGSGAVFIASDRSRPFPSPSSSPSSANERDERDATRRDRFGWISKNQSINRAPSSRARPRPRSTGRPRRRARRCVARDASRIFFARDARRRRLTRHPSRLVSSRHCATPVVVRDRAMPTSSSSDDRTAVFVSAVALGEFEGSTVESLARSSRLSSFLVGPRATSSSSRRRRAAARRY